MEKFIYKYRRIIKASIIVPLVLLAISYGCQNNDVDQKPDKLNYSGEEIFRGIFFSQGKLPTQIEALKPEHEKSEIAMATNKNVKEFKIDFSNEIVKSIKLLDPTFFTQFKKQMESKNYYAIQLALTNGTKMIKAAGYKSKYSGFFKLSDDLESKKADLTSKEFKDININTPEGLAKYKSLIKDKYDINIDDDNYKIACSPAAVVCVYFAAAAYSIVAVATSYVAGAYTAVAVAVVYYKVEYWGGGTNENVIGNVLIEELAMKLGSS